MLVEDLKTGKHAKSSRGHDYLGRKARWVGKKENDKAVAADFLFIKALKDNFSRPVQLFWDLLAMSLSKRKVSFLDAMHPCQIKLEGIAGFQ